jgi:phosphatidylinositol-3-phosphatase
VKSLLVTLLAVAAFAHGAAAQAPVPVPVPVFRHVVVIVFENKEFASVIGNSAAPTFNAMARSYATITEYYGVSHPSLPNYLALVSGSTHGIHTDCTRCVVSGKNLADTLEHAGKTWKLYAEGLPRAAFKGPSRGRYAKKHAPFLYFRDVARSRARSRRIVPFSTLGADLRSGRLPDFSLLVPNLCDSMHDCPVHTGDAWLGRQLPPLLALPNTVVFVVFDEGATDARGGGHVPALALGTAVVPGSDFTGVTDHYGLLRTVEDAWSLPLLGLSARAAPITGIWR